MNIKQSLTILFLSVLITGCSKSLSTPTLEPFTANTIPVINPVNTNFELVDCSTLYNQQPNQSNLANQTDQANQPDQVNQPPNDENDTGLDQCGYLSVPEDRRLDDGPTIKIAVTIHMSSSTTRQKDPVVLVGTGSSLGRGRFFGPSGAFAEMFPDRDVILFDVRGTGRSVPAYNCTDYSGLPNGMTSENLSMSEWEDSYIKASRACRDQLESAGANLSTFTSTAVAADMENLRQALGYSQWNVYASSNGTRIAMSLMRDYPESLRSVVLDSPWPLQADPFAEQAIHAEQVLDTIFQYCAQDEQCNRYYPSLKNFFYEDMDALNAQPISVKTSNLNTGVQSNIVVDGNRLLDFVLEIISSSRMDQLNEVPRMIYQLHDNKVTVLSELLSQSNGFNNYRGGVEQLIQCNDEAGTSSLDAIAAGIAQAELSLQSYFKIYSEASWRACQELTPESLSTEQNEPVTSDVPTLLLTRDLNWRTPASWATLTAQTLSHAYTVEFHGNGQSITSFRSQSDCSNSIVKAFLNEPGLQPDTICAADVPNFVWITLP